MVRGTRGEGEGEARQGCIQMLVKQERPGGLLGTLSLSLAFGKSLILSFLIIGRESLSFCPISYHNSKMR